MHDDKFVRGAEFGELRPNVLQEREQVTQARGAIGIPIVLSNKAIANSIRISVR